MLRWTLGVEVDLHCDAPLNIQLSERGDSMQPLMMQLFAEDEELEDEDHAVDGTVEKTVEETVEDMVATFRLSHCCPTYVYRPAHLNTGGRHTCHAWKRCKECSQSALFLLSKGSSSCSAPRKG